MEQHLLSLINKLCEVSHNQVGEAPYAANLYVNIKCQVYLMIFKKLKEDQVWEKEQEDCLLASSLRNITDIEGSGIRALRSEPHPISATCLAVRTT